VHALKAAVRYSVAGVSFELQLSGRAMRPMWEPFAQPAQANPLVVEVEWTPEDPALPVCRPLPLLERRGALLLLRGPGVEGELQGDSVRLRCADVHGLEAALKTLLAERLGARGGLLVHAAGIGLGEEVAVFPGRSGAGKSTLVSLARAEGFEILSDELVALVSAGERVMAYGTPWNVGAPACGALRVVGSLHHAPAHRILPETRADSLRNLLPNVVLTESGARARSAAFSRAAELLTRVECGQVEFALAPGLAEPLRELLSRVG